MTPTASARDVLTLGKAIYAEVLWLTQYPTDDYSLLDHYLIRIVEIATKLRTDLIDGKK